MVAPRVSLHREDVALPHDAVAREVRVEEGLGRADRQPGEVVERLRKPGAAAARRVG